VNPEPGTDQFRFTIATTDLDGVKLHIVGWVEERNPTKDSWISTQSAIGAKNAF
jgi:hypothetical protein